MSDKERDEDRPRIKVTDRRMFDSAGNLKEDDAGVAPDTTEVEPKNNVEPLTEPAAGDEAPITVDIDESPAAAAGSDDPQLAAPAPSIADLPRDFESFVENMYLEAMLYMGAIPDPRTGETLTDLELAEYKIDTLSMIHEKTASNLNEAEQTQITEALYQLRMVFVQKSQG